MEITLNTKLKLRELALIRMALEHEIERRSEHYNSGAMKDVLSSVRQAYTNVTSELEDLLDVLDDMGPVR